MQKVLGSNLELNRLEYTLEGTSTRTLITISVMDITISLGSYLKTEGKFSQFLLKDIILRILKLKNCIEKRDIILSE